MESQNNTITINHGANGTTEKTTVDTNPQKVLEHENLVSDSEYITLNHQTGENTTHIQAVKLKEKLDDLQQNKQDTLTAGKGIIINDHTISTIATQNITHYTGEDFRAFREVFTNPSLTFETFTFDCEPQFTEREVTVNLKEKLKKFVRAGMTVSNGSISITNDGTTMKLINSAGSQNVHQQGTFTFSDYNPTGGGN